MDRTEPGAQIAIHWPGTWSCGLGDFNIFRSSVALALL
jgi:hypothetical protein